MNQKHFASNNLHSTICIKQQLAYISVVMLYRPVRIILRDVQNCINCEFHHKFPFLNEIVVKQFKPSCVIVGYDHHFGFEREGSPKFLTQFGKEYGFNVDVIEPITDENIIISSTHIRGLIKEGYVRRASFELGWVFGFEANVIHGAGRGKSLGFPTANFIPEETDQLVPANGVYFIRGRINGNNLYGMCNLGVRPTFDETDFVMEVHFFDLESNNIYGKKITVEFLERIRDEQKFSNPEELINQLNKDKQNCITLMRKYN